MSEHPVREAGLLLQVAASEVAWELGRDHPLFDRLMLAVTRHQSTLNANPEPAPGMERHHPYTCGTCTWEGVTLIVYFDHCLSAHHDNWQKLALSAAYVPPG